MLCDICNAVLSIEQEKRKRKYCSQRCRSMVYGRLERKKDLAQMEKTGNFDRLHIWEVKKLGYDVQVTLRVGNE